MLTYAGKEEQAVLQMLLDASRLSTTKALAFLVQAGIFASTLVTLVA